MKGIRAGMMADQLHPLYGRLSFGADQRYASRDASSCGSPTEKTPSWSS